MLEPNLVLQLLLGLSLVALFVTSFWGVIGWLRAATLTGYIDGRNDESRSVDQDMSQILLHDGVLHTKH